MYFIRPASTEDIPSIHDLAHRIWPYAYEGILSGSQIQFMLDDMYSYQSLEKQFESGKEFLIGQLKECSVAFASYSTLETSILSIHKLYVLPGHQGKGVGKQLFSAIKDKAFESNTNLIELNVNRGNSAIHFYKKLGLEVCEEADIPYYAFTLNDYIMRMYL